MIDYSNLLYRQSIYFNGFFHWKTILSRLYIIIMATGIYARNNVKNYRNRSTLLALRIF